MAPFLPSGNPACEMVSPMFRADLSTLTNLIQTSPQACTEACFYGDSRLHQLRLTVLGL